ncbi:hypothetical protein PG990_008177 [Apiospora arundinis]
MVLHHAADDEDGGVIEPLLTRASSSTNATITQQPPGVTEGYYTIPPPDQKYFHFDGEPQHLMNPSRRHSIAGYQHHHHSHHHHDLVVAPLRPLILPPSERRRTPQPPVVVDEDAVIRKIDWRLMPLLFVTQVLASADAAALASAVFLGGLPEDAHLQQGASDYRALTAWLWLGYLLWVYPTCFFLSTLSTGGPSTAHGKRGRSASNSSSFYTSMYSANSSESLSLFFLSSASSDSSSIISTSSDSSSFASVVSTTNDGSNASSGDFGFGFFVGILPSWSPWRWIFVLLGAATFLWGFVILYRLLDPITPSSSLSDSTNYSSSKAYSTAPPASNFPGTAAERQRAEKEASYHTAVHTILLCHLSIVALAFGLRTWLRRRNRTKQDNEMTEVIDVIETRGGVTEYSLYRGAVDEEAYYHDNGETAISGGNDHLLPDDFDDMTDWKIPGFQYRC